MPDFDYSSNGAYYVTIVAHERKCLFGQIVTEQLFTTPLGDIIEAEWKAAAVRRPSVQLGPFVLMPNHLHAIIMIRDLTARETIHDITPGKDIQARSGPRRNSIAAIAGGFKSSVTSQHAKRTRNPNTRVWQRNYYEHIIRDDKDWQAIAAYIASNPTNWHQDSEFVP